SIENIPRNPSGDKPAYILYTSGSTGKPRGVLQGHGNILYFIRNWTAQFSITPGDRITLFASFSHDGSIPDIYSALLNGAVLYPRNIKEEVNTDELPKWLIDKKITIWHSVPTLFRYFVHTLDNQDNQENNYNYFPGLRFIVLGGEPVIRHDVNMFKRFFPTTTLANIYGQTESTVNSFWMVKPGDLPDRVLIGDPIDETGLLIIDENGGVVEDFGTGEIFVASEHVALEYWQDTETSQKVFLHDPDLGRLYRTGDFARLISTGNIEFLGRKDTQVKVRGFRVELGEIETALLTHELIKEAVVIDRQKEDGETYLCAYIVPVGAGLGESIDIDTRELRNYLAGFLPGYMIPARVVSLDKMPLTPSNKIDRKALPDPGTLQGQAMAPRDEIERKLAVIWAEVLGEQSPSSIGIDDNYFELGGHSLKATLMVSKIRKELNVDVPLTEIFDNLTIRKLSQTIKGLKEEQYTSIEAAEEKEYYPLSSAQQRIFVLHQIEPDSINYNLPIAWMLEGEIETKKLEAAFRKLIQRHESLRTSFIMVDGEPVQRIHKQVDFKIEGATALISSFLRPFDLSRAPLLRVGLIKIEKNKHVLMIDMYHIISDATSMGIMQKEFMTLYEERDIPGLRIQYKDYAEWQNRLDIKESEENKKQEKYWLKQFKDEVPVLNLPTDFTRPSVQSLEGNTMAFEIGSEDTGALRVLALEEKATLYMVLLAIFNILVSKLSRQVDIIIGTPVIGRSHANTHSIIGMFVNTLAMRNYPNGAKTFREFLQEVKENALAAFENQDYPFEDLVEKLEVNRDMSRNPLFDVMFELQNVETHAVEIPGLKSLPYDFDYPVSKFDLVFQALEIENKLFVTTRYCKKLFKHETLERIIECFKKIVYSIIKDVNTKISRVEFVPEEEKRKILYDFNETGAWYQKDKLIHELFEKQVEEKPDNTALVGGNPKSQIPNPKHGAPFGQVSNAFGGMHLTYRELNEKSNQLARLLIEKGVKPGAIVAIMLERSMNMIIGILGILKVGGAYLPIDPEYPEERIQYMLTDSSAKILLTGQEIAAFSSPEAFNNSPNLAYVLYTSGSTGKPKGVMVEHSPVVNILTALQRRYPLAGLDTYLLKTSYVFDVSVTELFGWFLGGGRVVILEKGGEKDPGKILDTIRREEVTHINFVPSMFNMLVEELNPVNISKLSGLKYIFLAGEVLLPKLVNKFRRLHTGIRLENIYGPTEGTIYSSGYSLSGWKSGRSIPIGKPMQNTRLYILDKDDLLQPIGIP
ncbi:MAG: AMP-binding protein, partial [Candidatus Aminicenantes bacterium]